MKDVRFIDLIRERNMYTDKKVSVFARLTTYFLSFVLLFFFLLFVIIHYTSNFWFSVFISAIFTFVFATWIILATKQKYIAEMESKKNEYSLKRRTENLYLLSDSEIEDFALKSILKALNGTSVEQSGVIRLCNGNPVVLMILGMREINQCDKIKMYLNMGYDKVIAVCTQKQKNILQKYYSENISLIITDTEIAADFDCLEYTPESKPEFDILSVLNAKTASAFIKLSTLFAVLWLLSGKMRYFGGICFIFGIIGIALKIISCNLTVRK